MSLPSWGTGGREFKSRRSDQLHKQGADRPHLLANLDDLEARQVHKSVHRRTLRMVRLQQDKNGNFLARTLDLAENGRIAVMLWTWPNLSHGLVEISSLATRIKIMAGVLTEALMGALAVIWLTRWAIRRRA
jgi:hypothetical protein